MFGVATLDGVNRLVDGLQAEEHPAAVLFIVVYVVVGAVVARGVVAGGVVAGGVVAGMRASRASFWLCSKLRYACCSKSRCIP
jgi:hypothetical protein